MLPNILTAFRTICDLRINFKISKILVNLILLNLFKYQYAFLVDKKCLLILYNIPLVRHSNRIQRNHGPLRNKRMAFLSCLWNSRCVYKPEFTYVALNC
ncbi:hypothetical protein BpHYR1_005049, partial [Brachionus plicatilis]